MRGASPVSRTRLSRFSSPDRVGEAQWRLTSWCWRQKQNSLLHCCGFFITHSLLTPDGAGRNTSWAGPSVNVIAFVKPKLLVQFNLPTHRFLPLSHFSGLDCKLLRAESSFSLCVSLSVGLNLFFRLVCAF